MPEELDLDAAVARLAAGGLLAYPTETVWGLGADATRAQAVAALLAFKGRPAGTPVSILVSGVQALEGRGFRVGDAAGRALAAFWPGPLTAVLPCRGGFAPGVARTDGAVGVRCSSHPAAARLAAACERAGAGPPTATSCNRSGASEARSREEARRVCAEGDVALLADGADAGGGAPSTVVDFCGARPAVLRAGALSERALASVVGALEAA